MQSEHEIICISLQFYIASNENDNKIYSKISTKVANAMSKNGQVINNIAIILDLVIYKGFCLTDYDCIGRIIKYHRVR